MKYNVLVTRAIPEKGLDLLRRECLLDIWPEALPPSRDELLCMVEGIDGLLCLLSDTIDEEVMQAAGEQLKVISNYAVGTDNIDLQAAIARNIKVGNTPGVLTEATADLAFALLMAAARRVVEGSQYVQAGKWKTWGPKLLLGADVYGATLGIIGFGRIGQALACRAKGFNMKTLFYSRSEVPLETQNALNATPCDLETLLRISDFISIHVPLTEETHHLIDEDAIAMMKPTAVLVNTARGGVVDTPALYDALKTGKIACAALDVTDPEPLPANHPLMQLENCIITPHIGSASRATRNQMSLIAAQNLLAGLHDEELPFPVF